MESKIFELLLKEGSFGITIIFMAIAIMQLWKRIKYLENKLIDNERSSRGNWKEILNHVIGILKEANYGEDGSNKEGQRKDDFDFS